MAEEELIVAQHADVKKAFGLRRLKSFRLEEVERPIIFAFWANDVERDSDGKVIIHHGHEMAVKYKNSYSADKDVKLLEDFHGHGGVFDLNEYEKSGAPKEVVNAVCGVTSFSYASEAKGTILASVKGASINSFFRTVELDVIMNNDKVTDVINISRGDSDGKVYPKREAYHILRDEWIEASNQRFHKAQVDYFSNKDNPAFTAAYESAREEFALEMVECKRMLREEYPFSRGMASLKTSHARYTEVDKAQEERRLKTYHQVLELNPDLVERVNELSEIRNTLNSTHKIISFLRTNSHKEIFKKVSKGLIKAKSEGNLKDLVESLMTVESSKKFVKKSRKSLGG